MKKVWLVAMLAVCLIFGGCQSKVEKYDASLSERQLAYMDAEKDGDTVTLISGFREDPYTIDGKTEGRADYTVVTFRPKEAPVGASYTYSMHIDSVLYEGNLYKHPFDNSYSFEVATQVKSDTVAITIEETSGYVVNFDLKSKITADMIDSEVALEIALIRLKSRVKEMTQDGVINAEIYIRFIENPISPDGGYYWYVAFIPERYTVYAVLIDPITKEICAVRE